MSEDDATSYHLISPQAPCHWIYDECPLEEAFSIRLLRLHRHHQTSESTSPDPVNADLISVSLQNAPPYIALSYSWGDQLADKSINIGPLATISISKHLEDALRQLSQPTQGVLVWVDALCINQNDLEERSRQVGIMKQIFSSAESVYIWLGLAPEPLPRKSLEDGPDTGDLRWMVSVSPQTRQNEGFVGLSIEDLNALHAWGEHAWWKRKWVLQEIAVAKRPPLVLYDQFLFDGWAFFRAWPDEHVFFRQWDVKANDLDYDVVGTQKVWKAFMSTEHSMRIPWKLRSWWEYYEVPLHGGRPLGELLRLAAASNASNDLDHVFALIGLTTTTFRDAIPIDYTKNADTLFLDVSRLLWSRKTNPTQHSIEKDSEHSSFDALSFQWDRYRTPSWACNFARPTTIDRTDFQTWIYITDQHQISHLEASSLQPSLHDMSADAFGEQFSSRVADHSHKRWGHHNVVLDIDVPASFDDPGATLDDSLIPIMSSPIDEIERAVNAVKYSKQADAWHAIAIDLGCEEQAIRAMRLGLSRYATAEMTPDQFSSYTFFSTTRGHVGLCYTTISREGRNENISLRRGDAITLMLGANTPFVLRPKGNNPLHHVLVSACMLSNDACGCRLGKIHKITKLERLIMC